jgi:hypothetical protein
VGRYDPISVIRVDSYGSASLPASLALLRTTFSGNRLFLPNGVGSGSAIDMSATANTTGTSALTVSFCTFFNNSLGTAFQGSRGGAIRFDSAGGNATISIADSVFSQNHVERAPCGRSCVDVEAGAIWVRCMDGDAPCLRVARTQFLRNYCWDDGGALFVSQSVSHFDTVLFEGNVAESTGNETGYGSIFFDSCK